MIWFIFKFAPVKTFTNTVILRSKPLRFPSGSELNPSSNPPLNSNDGNSDSRLLLLLFPKDGLL